MKKLLFDSDTRRRKNSKKCLISRHSEFEFDENSPLNHQVSKKTGFHCLPIISDKLPHTVRIFNQNATFVAKKSKSIIDFIH